MRIEDTTILITDDSILARKQLKDIISTLGTPVFVEATDGQSAIDKYKEVHPDLVFLDIVMPKKDGNDAIRDIMEFDPEATIIIASSVSDTAAGSISNDISCSCLLCNDVVYECEIIIDRTYICPACCNLFRSLLSLNCEKVYRC